MKLKCNKCYTTMHDQENSYFVFNWDRGASIRYNFEWICRKFKIEIKYDENGKMIDLSKEEVELLSKKIKKANIKTIILEILEPFYNYQFTDGVVWRCPVCGNPQIIENDWPNKGKIWPEKEMEIIIKKILDKHFDKDVKESN